MTVAAPWDALPDLAQRWPDLLAASVVCGGMGGERVLRAIYFVYFIE